VTRDYQAHIYSIRVTKGLVVAYYSPCFYLYLLLIPFYLLLHEAYVYFLY